ncbi:MAG: polyprenyl synthetase family protein [Fimbriimonas sp.]
MIAPSLKVLANGRADSETLQRVTDEVTLVEEELVSHLRSGVALVQRVGHHTLQAGGKRLRPAFVVLAAQATGRPFDVPRARRLGASMEMIHMATLIHDDVIDDASTRRGRPTAAREFGNTAAILGGDALLAKAMLLLARDGDVSLIRTVSEAVVDMAEGEVRELETRGDFDLDIENHLEVLRLKTASLIECCCELGALVAGAPPEYAQALRVYGYHVGMAFQIVDDLLDYRGDKAKTGKPKATDFREGQATLPLIYLIPELSEAEAAIVRRKFGNDPSDDEIRMLAGWMDTRGAFARAEKDARGHVERALEALAPLPEGSSRELLVAVAEYVVRREL